MKYDLEGKTFGKLTALKPIGYDKQRYMLWECKCSCGNTKIIRSSHLIHGRIKSCGCISKKANGFARNRIYRIWKGILARCFNEKDPNYRRYGGKGRTVCNEWKKDFMSFYKWSVNNGYRDNLSIDRINNKGNYEPSNCRWATAREQSNNTSQNVFISFRGQKLTKAQWARKIGIKIYSFNYRIKKYGICDKIFNKNMANC